MDDLNIDDPSDFKTAQLRNIDQELRCGICSEFMVTPLMVTTCQHVFCAKCIRKRLSDAGIDAQCPLCHVKTSESRLVRIPALIEIVANWSAIRPHLLEMEQPKQEEPPQQTVSNIHQNIISTTSHMQTSPSSSPSPSPSTVSASSASPSLVSPSTRRSRRIEQKSSQSQEIPAPSFPESSTLACDTDMQSPPPNNSDFKPPPRIPATTHTPPQLSRQVQPPTQSAEGGSLQATSIVSCPMCSQQMSFREINAHVDMHLRGVTPTQSKPSPSSSSSSSRSPAVSLSPLRSSLPSTRSNKRSSDEPIPPSRKVYNLLKDKDMRQVMRETGLPEHGDKKLMEWRHKEYITLYNANRDAKRPVGKRQLLQQLQESETIYLQSKATPRTLDVNAHKRAYEDDFARLIEQARKRQNVAKNKNDAGSSTQSLNTGTGNPPPSPPAAAPPSGS